MQVCLYHKGGFRQDVLYSTRCHSAIDVQSVIRIIDFQNKLPKLIRFDIDLTMMYFITKEYVHITCPAKNNYVISCSIIMK